MRERHTLTQKNRENRAEEMRSQRQILRHTHAEVEDNGTHTEEKI